MEIKYLGRRIVSICSKVRNRSAHTLLVYVGLLEDVCDGCCRLEMQVHFLGDSCPLAGAHQMAVQAPPLLPDPGASISGTYQIHSRFRVG